MVSTIYCPTKSLANSLDLISSKAWMVEVEQAIEATSPNKTMVFNNLEFIVMTIFFGY